MDPKHFLWAILLCLLNVAVAKAVSKKRQTLRHGLAIICSAASIIILALCKFSILESPIGFSFLVFSIVSFQMDGKKGDSSWSILDGFLYLSFFPKLTMGPIVRFQDFLSDLHRDEPVMREDLDAGVRQCIHGLFKKAVLADLIGEYADLAFARTSQLTTAAAWVGLLLYALQLYYDFSGYSDLAIGSARLFGFRFEKNFDHPYLSTSLTDFWRRWHITLGAWFRNYLYFPLGGSRKGKVRTCLNLLIVFAATGLWHGANWTFVLWGLLHGVVMVVERIGLRRRLLRLPHWVQTLDCDLLVCIGWVLFRSST
ncbi:MBOAT family O-acyltransferase, partial [Galactobacillus timonensis]|uniref:MBOAT family O-acyltransferase n=1 Tax=Galactobacillus timonensis TaxID=2041840 RepID=UPI00240A7133